VSDKKNDSPKEILPAASQAKESASESSKKLSTLIPLVAIGLAGLSLVAAAYLWQNGQQQQQLLKTSLTSIEHKLEIQLTANRELQRHIDQQAINVETQQQKNIAMMGDLQRKLASQQQRLQALSTTDREDWSLAEAEYLMKLANQRVLMGKDVESAAELLTSADGILREVNDAALYSVRQVIAEEITALKSTAQFDLEGLYLQISALAKQANNLPLFEVPSLTIETPSEQDYEDWQQTFDSSVEQAWNKLSHYVQIKRRDDIYKPLLAPEHEAAVRNNLQLMFEQAQSALLSGKQKLYDDSLKKSRAWLDSYYSINEGQLKQLNDLIEEVQKQTITITLPDISASSRALKNYIETRHKIVSKAPVAEEEKENVKELPAEPDSDGIVKDNKL
jgi:uroporphyrin-III C-methyltransferase